MSTIIINGLQNMDIYSPNILTKLCTKPETLIVHRINKTAQQYLHANIETVSNATFIRLVSMQT